MEIEKYKMLINKIYKFLYKLNYFCDDINRQNEIFKKMIYQIIYHIKLNQLCINRVNILSCGCDDVYCIELFDKYGLIDLIVFDFDFEILGYMDYLKSYDDCECDIKSNDCNDCFYCKYIGKL